MEHEILSHADTDLVTREKLIAVPAPERTATFQPLPHLALVTTFFEALEPRRICT